MGTSNLSPQMRRCKVAIMVVSIFQTFVHPFLRYVNYSSNSVIIPTEYSSELIIFFPQALWDIQKNSSHTMVLVVTITAVMTRGNSHFVPWHFP